MIYSMTAFSRMQNQGEWGDLVCEMRSINHRYLEVGIHMPDNLRLLEMPIRELFKQKIKRGKIECVIRYKPNLSLNNGNSIFSLNTELAKELSQACEKLAVLLPQAAAISPLDILRYPGVLENQEYDTKKLHAAVIELVNQTLTDLLESRAREGQELLLLFSQRIHAMQAELETVKTRLPLVITEQREKILKRFADLQLEVDTLRLEQEMVIYIQRMDVAEEVDRIKTHINEVGRVLKQGGLAGRRLDFLLQELNREANTLGSKSNDFVLTHAVVEMKVLIEQIREQVQNVE